MTPKQILNSFSETLMQDERILSAQERALVVSLLQHAKTAAGSNPELQEAVRKVVSSAVGETVAQRAFAVLGGSIVEHIIDGCMPPAEVDRPDTSERQVSNLNVPPPPSPSPGQPQSPGAVRAEYAGRTVPTLNAPPPPSPSPSPHQPQSPGTPLRAPVTPPPASQPQSPGTGSTTTVISHTGITAAAVPTELPAKCVVLDEFLSPSELKELTQFTLEHENDFQISEVISPTAEGGVVNYEYRRSRVLMDAGKHQDVLVARIKSALPQILEKLGMEEFAISSVEAQITASNDEDFFQFHSDNGSEPVASRHLTFVYFFHGEPRQFEGGELRLHDARLRDGAYTSKGTYQSIVPQQNQIVFFPCELLHEITRVRCSSRLFADSRFTLNGWLRR